MTDARNTLTQHPSVCTWAEVDGSLPTAPNLYDIAAGDDGLESFECDGLKCDENGDKPCF